MAAPKKRRIPVTIDMTPMVDIAFLLLIFFMSTTQFKDPTLLEIKNASSHSKFKIPDKGMLVVTVPEREDNLVALGTGDISLDKAFGLTASEHGNIRARLFPADSIEREINHVLVLDSGGVQVARYRVERIVIKADRDAAYGTVESIMSQLQKMELNVLNLVTDFEDEKVAK